MTERLVAVDGVELCIDTFGAAADPVVLLISGITGSMDNWEPEFCRRLADAGRYVIRYDHRDTGRSTSYEAGKPAYTSDDLTTDPLRLLDALGISRAHLVGLSMGGGIAQDLTARYPERLHTLTLIATTIAGTSTHQRTLPPMDPRLGERFANPIPEPEWDDRDAVIGYLVEGVRPYAGSLGFDEEWAYRMASTVVDRTRDIRASLTNHWLLENGSSPPFTMADIRTPTLVMHGTSDPLFPPQHGEALADEISGAVLLRLDGMGHESPPPTLWDVVIPAIVRHTAAGSDSR